MNPITTSLSFSKCFTLLVFLLLTACAHAGAPIHGRVLEEGTDKPIPGAIVVVRWQGDLFAFVESQRVCLHVETATTDEQGHFHTPMWVMGPSVGFVSDVEPSITAYKPDYTFGTKPSEKETVWLKPFTGTRGERFKYLTAGTGTPCGQEDGSKKNLLPFYKARYEEIKNLAVSEQDRELADGFLTGVETLELGSEVADQRREQRRLDRLKEKR